MMTQAEVASPTNSWVWKRTSVCRHWQLHCWHMEPKIVRYVFGTERRDPGWRGKSRLTGLKGSSPYVPPDTYLGTCTRREVLAAR